MVAPVACQQMWVYSEQVRNTNRGSAIQKHLPKLKSISSYLFFKDLLILNSESKLASSVCELQALARACVVWKSIIESWRGASISVPQCTGGAY